jgi:hypothetical protein
LNKQDKKKDLDQKKVQLHKVRKKVLRKKENNQKKVLNLRHLEDTEMN